jgi:hypothetical protein
MYDIIGIFLFILTLLTPVGFWLEWEITKEEGGEE